MERVAFRLLPGAATAVAAGSKRDKSVQRNGTAVEAHWDSGWRILGQRMNGTGTGCIEARQRGPGAFIEFMTKVIFAGTDERGGCENAHPGVAEDLAEKKMHRGQERD